METKNVKPDYVANFERPAGTEIKYISGHWYLYERRSVYDPVTKKKRKKSGALLGTITEEGFKHRKLKIEADQLKEVQCVEYGASGYLYQSNQTMIEKLKLFFPNTWKKIFTMAALKCIGETTLKRIPTAYETSWLSVLFGDLKFTTSGLTADIRKLGRNRNAICQYMRNGLSAFSGFILIDGHRIISESRGLPFAQLGYDSRMRYSHQINLLYLFGSNKQGRMPLYYKQFAGSVPDCLALPDISEESGISGTEITVIADKGFGTEDDFSAIIDSGMKYIIPLKRNTSEIDAFPKDHSSYERVFNFRERSVYCNKYEKGDYIIYLYYDMLLAMHETNDAVDRLNGKNNANEATLAKETARRSKGKTKLTEAQIADMQSIDVARTLQDNAGIGTLILRSNRMDLNEAQIYAFYKTRQEIEQSFKSYDDTLALESSHMQDTDAFEGWLFINHLSLQMLYGVLDFIAQVDLTSKYSFKDVIRTLEGIRANKINGEWHTTKYTKNTNKFCRELNIKIEDSCNRDT